LPHPDWLWRSGLKGAGSKIGAARVASFGDQVASAGTDTDTVPGAARAAAGGPLGIGSSRRRVPASWQRSFMNCGAGQPLSA
jgi:hypothetical protein